MARRTHNRPLRHISGHNDFSKFSNQAFEFGISDLLRVSNFEFRILTRPLLLHATDVQRRALRTAPTHAQLRRAYVTSRASDIPLPLAYPPVRLPGALQIHVVS
jgi:hypothetical protein